MAGAEKISYQDPTMAMISQLAALGGEKGSASSTSSGNPAGAQALQQILNSQMGGTTPEGAAALLHAIFSQGMEAVPGLATTYGQAAGARSSNNSPFQLALQDMMLKLTQEGARQLSTNQQAAARTASELAQTQKTTTTSETKKPGTSALQLAPFILANAGKIKKFFDPETAKALDAGTPQSAGFNLSPRGFDTSAGVGADSSGDFGFGSSDAMGFDFGSASNAALDFGAMANSGSDAFGFDFGGSSAGDFSFDTMGTDYLDGGFLGFKNGGIVRKKMLRRGKDEAETVDNKYEERKEPKGYANGGMVRKGYADGGVASKDEERNNTTFANNQLFNTTDVSGRKMRGVTYNESGAYSALLATMLEGINGGSPGIGHTGTPGPGAKPKKPENESSDSGSTEGAGLATGQVGTPAENAAAMNGFAAALASAVTGIPGIAMGLNMMGVPAMSMNPISHVVNALVGAVSNSFTTPSAGADATVGEDGVSPGSVSAATGVAGANAGGLGGMGVSMGLDAGFDPSADASGGGNAGDSGGGVGDAASAGVGGGGFKKGGEVQGPGGPTDDLVPAMLSDGEFVIKAKAVNALGEDFLNMLNSMFDGAPSGR